MSEDMAWPCAGALQGLRGISDSTHKCVVWQRPWGRFGKYYVTGGRHMEFCCGLEGWLTVCMVPCCLACKATHVLSAVGPYGWHTAS